MAEVPTSEPLSIRAGDSVTWRKTLADYPAGTWTLAYRLLSASEKVDLTVTPDGTDHVVTLTAAASSALPPGDHTLVGTVTSGSERATVYQGAVRVLANLATQSSHDGRSWAQTALDAARAKYQEWIESGGHLRLEYEVAGRRMKFADSAGLIQHIRFLEQEVAREKIAAQLGKGTGLPPGRVMVRM